MENKLRTFIFATFALFLLSVSALACSCLHAMEANNFTGQVFALQKLEPKRKPEINYEKPIAKATVKLWQQDDSLKYKVKLVAEVTTDENGRFSLENINPGKYSLDIYADGFDGFSSMLTISEFSNRSKDKIEIGLPPPFHCCIADVKVQKTENNLKDKGTPNRL